MIETCSAVFSPEEFARLLTAMNWVIPPDSTLGAGTDACASHLIALIRSLDESVVLRYKASLLDLTEPDLDDKNNKFAQEFIEHVRNSYYGYADTGAWEDIGFAVTG